METSRKYSRWKRAVSMALCLLLALTVVLPAALPARAEGKVVRVGWYECPFNYIDQFGRRFGYAYEYQQKIAAYTGWEYEYVEGSWPELMQMLVDGEIDLMSDVSYTEERAQLMGFSSLPMGTESYYLFVAADNTEITPRDYSRLNGKRIGANVGSIQLAQFKDWARANGFNVEIVELTVGEQEAQDMLIRGELDGLITLDAYGDADNCKPICKTGQSDFYFAVSKDRTDLLSELNDAVYRIQDGNRYYNQSLYERYVRLTGANVFLSVEEENWLAAHGKIRIGYRDKFLPFCAADAATGELTGTLNDYMKIAYDCLHNATVEFEAVAYPTTEDALAALKSGQLDCVFPANLSVYDGEVSGLMTTSPLMTTEMYAVMRENDRRGASPEEELTVAVNEGNPNYEVFMKDHFPNWEVAQFEGSDACFEAVGEGKADCTLVSNYRVTKTQPLQEQYHLHAKATGEAMDYAFAVRRGENELYSILNKTINLSPEASIESSLSSWSYPETRVTFLGFLRDNWLAVMVIMAAVFAAILVLLIQKLQVQKRAYRDQLLISAAESDDLTGLYGRAFFFEYADRMHHNHPDRPMDAVVVNIEQFHSVNALNGREFGDLVLRTLGAEIKDFADEADGIGGRFEADHFAVFCAPQENYQVVFDRFQAKLDELSPDARVRVRMGVMPWERDANPTQMFDRARTACGMVRGSYRSHLMVFNEEARRREAYGQRLLNDLPRALKRHEFEVYYQPKYDIREEVPALNSAEALIRWHHSELGLIPPGDFIPLMEREGQIGLVDRYVWTEVARQIAVWRGKLGVTFPISVNLSRVDVFDPALENFIDELVASNKLDRSALKLELTESAYAENAAQLIDVIRRLREKGYEIEMDDFGTGYSSLNMLSSMPVDALKMDRMFIQNIDKDEKNIRLVELILDIAKSLKVPVVAEGVETEGQFELLRELGCALVQGYYLSRPLPAADFEELLAREMTPRA